MKPLIDRFRQDAPTSRGDGGPRTANLIADPIDGCSATRLIEGGDHRGTLVELATTREGPIEPIVHVYQVHAGPRSLRAWVLHRRQGDRLCFTNGRLKVVLYDAREDSPTFGKLNELIVGRENRVLLTIPAFVVHGVQNLEDVTSTFVNMPTRAYDHADPDKYRLPADSPLIPYSFEA